MNMQQRKQGVTDLFEKYRAGRLEASKGILTFVVAAILVFVAGLATLAVTAFDGLGISLMVIALLVLLLGVAAKA